LLTLAGSQTARPDVLPGREKKRQNEIGLVLSEAVLVLVLERGGSRTKDEDENDGAAGVSLGLDD
jgi:hypothetical protein